MHYTSEIAELSYVERRVIALARVYVSVKRVYFSGRDNSRMRADEIPRYHQKNVVAYPQNPDTVLRAVSLRPDDLCKALVVQFVGDGRGRLRSEPSLSVSVGRLRKAFAWLSTNS